MSRANFKIRFLSFEDAKTKWLALEKIAHATPYQNYFWLCRWMEHIGSHQEMQPLIVEGYCQDKTVFILPLMLQKKFGVTICRWLGRQEQNVNVGLYSPEYLDENSSLFEDTVRLIGEQHSQISLFYLEKQPETIGPSPNPALEISRKMEHPNKLFSNEMGDDFEAWESQQRSTKYRRNLAGKWRKLENLHGELRVERLRRSDEIASLLEVFVAQRDAINEKRGVPNPFSNAQSIKFFHSLINDFSESEEGFIVYGLRSGEFTHAISFSLFGNGSFSGFAHSMNLQSSKHSPGILLQREVLKLAHAKGFRNFDIGLGDAPYKRDWANEVTLYDNLHAVNLRGKAAKLFIQSYLMAKRTLKNTLRLQRVDDYSSQNTA